MLTEQEKAYLAGIVDGEGTITLRRTKGRIVVYAIALTNTNGALILHVGRLLKRAGIRTYLSKHACWAGRKGYKAGWQLLLAGIDNTKAFLNMIRPYLVGKARQADLVLEFLSNRRSGHHVGRKSARDLMIYDMLRDLNARGTSKSVETVRSEHLAEDVMIQSELYGDVQSEAEMPSPTHLQ